MRYGSPEVDGRRRGCRVPAELQCGTRRLLHTAAAAAAAASGQRIVSVWHLEAVGWMMHTNTDVSGRQGGDEWKIPSRLTFQFRSRLLTPHSVEPPPLTPTLLMDSAISRYGGAREAQGRLVVVVVGGGGLGGGGVRVICIPPSPAVLNARADDARRVCPINQRGSYAIARACL